jgi:hypothetical protein
LISNKKAIRWHVGPRSLAEALAINTGLTREDFSVAHLGEAFH